MKNIIKNIILITLLIVSTSCKSTSNKELNYDNYDLVIMIETEEEDGKYKKWDNIDWPNKEDYALNTALSTCSDGSSIEWDEEKGAVYLTSNNWDKCTAKFDKIIKIQYIEDLVELSKTVNGGNSLKGKTVKLMRDLDFKNSHANGGNEIAEQELDFDKMSDEEKNKIPDYKNAQDTQYENFNNDALTGQTIYNELTNAEGAGFVPIGTAAKPFKGIFDGNNHKIDNLYINNNSTNIASVGLIGFASNSVIKDLTVSGNIKSSVTADTGGIVGKLSGGFAINCVNESTISVGKNDYSTGGVVGATSTETYITNSQNKGNITIEYGGLVGGIVGGAESASKNEIIIENCVNTGTITASDARSIGGIFGSSNSNNVTIKIVGSQNKGNIKVTKPSTSNQDTYVGGIMASNSTKSIIRNCSNNADISVETDNGRTISVGGIIGYNYKGTVEISDSFNLNDINVSEKEQHSNVGYTIANGGILGYNINDTTIAKLNNVYNKGNITGGNSVGGIVGEVFNKSTLILNKGYNEGIIESNSLVKKRSIESGGIVGYSNGALSYIINSGNNGDIKGHESTDNYVLSSGIIGNISNTDGGAVILNSYNKGNIMLNQVPLGAIANYNKSANKKLVIDNVYNIGNISSTSKYGILYYPDKDIEYINLRHAYYLKNSDITRGTNLDNDLSFTIGLDDSAMKNREFTNTLNSNLKSINLESISSLLKDYELSSWVMGKDGYPVFDYEIEE